MDILINDSEIDPPSSGLKSNIKLNSFLPKVKHLIVTFSILALFAPTVSASFSDVPDSHSNFNAVDYLTKNTEVKGFGNGEFKPNQKITRAELIKSLVTLNYSPEEIDACEELPFSDVKEDNSFSKYICIAQRDNISNGYSDNTFRPDQNVKLNAAGKMILKSLEYDNDDSQFGLRLNHLKAIPTSIRCLESDLTRAEVAEIIFRIDNNITDRDHKEISDMKTCSEYFVSPLQHCGDMYYQSRGYSSGHKGIDYPLKMGKQNDRCEINSVGYGTVEKARNCRSLGNCVVVRHDNGMKTLYAHMTPELLVSEGQRVEPGQKIGVMGATGVSHGVHLHLSVSLNNTNVINYGNRVNPVGLLPT